MLGRLLLLACCLVLPPVCIASAEQPNIIIIYVDDLGYGDTGVYGHPVVTTPNIDQLAAEGLRFTQFYAPSALCSPSRAGLLTGRTPYRTGIKSWIPDNSDVSLNADEVTLAQLLKSKGYSTAVIGKWHLNGGLGMSGVPQPRDFGFDYQYGLDAWVKNEKAEAKGEGRLFPDNMYRNNQPVGETSKYSAELVSDDALQWLEDQAGPFFLLLTYSEVHTPVASPPEYVAQYDAFLTEESRDNPYLYYFNWAHRPYRGQGEYYANISYLDAQIGRVLTYLDERGLTKNSLVIFSSDNGPVTSNAEALWELGMAGETDGLRGMKRYLFEGGIRVPGIFRWPAQIAAGVADVPATALDVLPTVAAYLDIPLPEDRVIDGESLLPMLDDDPTSLFERQKLMYWSIGTPDGLEYAVRNGDWKLLLDSDGNAKYLFDLARDRYEVNNLLKAQPDVVARLLKEFRQYRMDVEQQR